MTELKPLGYAASLAIMLMVVAYAAVWQWVPEFPRHARLLWAAPWQILVWTVGKLIGGLSAMALLAMIPAWAIVDLWVPWGKPFVAAIMGRMARYVSLRVHRARHAS